MGDPIYVQLLGPVRVGGGVAPPFSDRGHGLVELVAWLSLHPDGVYGCEIDRDLVWATTWMQDANDTLAPLLGWPSLPVLDAVQPAAQDAYFRLHWKTRSIVRHAAGRDFAWVDDEITDADEEWIDEHHPGGAFLVRVDPRLGVTRDDLASVTSWIRRASAGTERPRT